jgi:hypothetical protein
MDGDGSSRQSFLPWEHERANSARKYGEPGAGAMKSPCLRTVVVHRCTQGAWKRRELRRILSSIHAIRHSIERSHSTMSENQITQMCSANQGTKAQSMYSPIASYAVRRSITARVHERHRRHRFKSQSIFGERKCSRSDTPCPFSKLLIQKTFTML